MSDESMNAPNIIPGAITSQPLYESRIPDPDGTIAFLDHDADYLRHEVKVLRKCLEYIGQSYSIKNIPSLIEQAREKMKLEGK